MILRYQLGFKNKLRIVITLALIGFIVLSAISFNALEVLGKASKRVDNINHNANLLKDLQLHILTRRHFISSKRHSRLTYA